MLTRIRFFLILFLFLFLIIFLRLFQLQILNHSSSKIFDYLAERKILPERGRIFDRLSNPLVLNNNSYLLYFEPKKIDDPDKMIKKISVILSMDEASLSSKFNKEKDWVAVTMVNKEKKEEIEKLKIRWFGI